MPNQLMGSLSDKINQIKDIFHGTKDLKTYSFQLEKQKGRLLYFETLIDTEKLEKLFFIPISQSREENRISSFTVERFQKSTEHKEIVNKLLNGFAVLMFESKEEAYFINTATSFDRSTDEPSNEKINMGSHQGSVENLNINLHLIRRAIENPDLFVKLHFQLIRTNCITHDD